MIKINENFLKLQAGYLFPEIGRRVREFAAKNPQAGIIKLGIGDVTEPLAPAVVEAMRIAAEQMGLGGTNLENIQILGDEPAEADVKRFRFCGQHLPSDMMGLGTFVPLFKDAVTSRPVVNHNLCSRCEECIEHCPASAMEMSPDGKNRVERVNIDLKTCIGCFCCSEICPEGAISVKQGWIWRLLPGFLK